MKIFAYHMNDDRAPDWYVKHFAKFGYNRESLNRIWRGLDDKSKDSYRKLLVSNEVTP